MKLQKKHKQRLDSWGKSKRGPQETEEMHKALGPYLTEAALDAALTGKLAEVEEAEDELPEPTEPEPGTPTVIPVGEVVANVEPAVVEAEKEQTEEEKKSGFWKRIGGFFKGVFKGKGK